MEQILCRAPLVAGLVLLAGLAAAGEAGGAHDCAKIPDDSARLACYDAAFGKPASAPRSGAVQASAAAAAATTTVTPASDPAKARQEFGLSETDKRALDPAKADEPSSISATVAGVKKRPTGEWVVTLQDGQVWVQSESYTKAIVKAGDVVTIRKASLGSYVLVSANRVAMRVRRIK